MKKKTENDKCLVVSKYHAWCTTGFGIIRSRLWQPTGTGSWALPSSPIPRHQHLPHHLPLRTSGSRTDRVRLLSVRMFIHGAYFPANILGEVSERGKHNGCGNTRLGLHSLSTSLLAEQAWAYYLIFLCPYILISNGVTSKPALLNTQWVHHICDITWKIISSV